MLYPFQQDKPVTIQAKQNHAKQRTNAISGAPIIRDKSREPTLQSEPSSRTVRATINRIRLSILNLNVLLEYYYILGFCRLFLNFLFRFCFISFDCFPEILFFSFFLWLFVYFFVISFIKFLTD
jgi:hypothetical protein